MTIPSSVTHIGKDAFISCENLTEVAVPESVVSIGEGAFRKCRNLKTAVISGDMTKISDDAFADCPLPADEEGFSVLNGTLFGYSGKGGHITVPPTVLRIGADVFSERKDITDVTIPGSVVSIGPRAFAHCTGLPEVDIPDSVKDIHTGAFLECTGIVKLRLPEGLETIGSYAFAKNGFKDITVPKSVKRVGPCTFIGCTSITVFDTIDPDADNCYEKLDFGTGNYNSAVGHIGVALAGVQRSKKWPTHMITVRSAENNEIKYRVLMESNPNQSNYYCFLTSGWGHNGTFAFRILDDNYKDINGVDLKGKIALLRLRYPVELSEESKAVYEKRLKSKGLPALKFCIDMNDKELLEFGFGLCRLKQEDINELAEYCINTGKTEYKPLVMELYEKCNTIKKKKSDRKALGE